MSSVPRHECEPMADRGPEASRGVPVAQRVNTFRRLIVRGQQHSGDDPDAQEMAQILLAVTSEEQVSDAIQAVGLAGRTGLTPVHARKIEDRNIHIRAIVRANPDWADLPTRVAAPLLLGAFNRYERNSWPREQFSKTPPGDPTEAHFWKILKLEIGVPVPTTIAHLARIIEGRSE